MATMTVHLRSGQSIVAETEPYEMDAWDYLMTTTVEGDRLRDQGMVILDVANKEKTKVYVNASDIVAVEMEV